MKKVITYGTYDLFHYGHQRLLERAKALGDYLIVGVTSDGFDRIRGKINVQQTLMERIEAVKAIGIADEVIVEEYEGQKIDDILRYGIDVFAIGSDWEGYFDYLKDYCQVVYLERTAGVSSTELRSGCGELRLGVVGDVSLINQVERESCYVNGLKVVGCYCIPMQKQEHPDDFKTTIQFDTDDYCELLGNVDAVYIISPPQMHYEQIKMALTHGKHVLCNSPIALTTNDWHELHDLAKGKECVLMDAICTAYSMAYYRMLLLVKSGRIGNVVSVDVSYTDFKEVGQVKEGLQKRWALYSYAPNALLPIFQILGTEFNHRCVFPYFEEENNSEGFVQIVFVYPKAVSSLKIGRGIETEEELVISGTTGYIYVPAPWWKMDYFEIRRKNSAQNKKYFYQFEGEGIRYELVAFLKSIRNGNRLCGNIIDDEVSEAFVRVLEACIKEEDVIFI